MKKLLFLLISVLAIVLAASAGTRDDFKANIKASANNLQAYPDSNLPQLTPAPSGYKPFYIDHYGRHGSRWLIDPKQYAQPVEQLAKADSAGKLTPRGREVLAVLRSVKAASHKRLGELSDVGAEQHQRIARRMYRNFPEVFAGQAVVDARSTVVIRCILSMLNEVDVLKSLNPAIKLTTDASEHDMYYMNYSDRTASQLRRILQRARRDSIVTHYVHPAHMLRVLFNDTAWASRNIDARTLMTNLWDVNGNMQSHHQFEKVDLYDLFSFDDVMNMWNYNNISWYCWSGFTPLTQNYVPYIESNLLRDFLGKADTAIASGRNGAHLRFGHESVLLPLVCLMGLNGMNYSTADIDHLTDRWQTYKVFPMASNVQWVFYRKPGSDDILVKILLNEREARLPAQVATDCAPYYHWRDVRRYMLGVLAAKPHVTLPAAEPSTAKRSSQSRAIGQRMRNASGAAGTSASGHGSLGSGLVGYTVAHWGRPHSDYEGTVVVRVHVSARGQVTRAEIAGGTISDAAARQSCLSESYKCRFSVPLNRTTEGIGTIIWRFV